MLDVAKLRAGRERYYLKEIAQRLDGYYRGEGEAPAWWCGRAPAEFGLEGVAADGSEDGSRAFLDVFYGKDPTATGNRLLGDRHRKDGVHAFDAVFQPVKSVSILYGLGGQEIGNQVLEVHQSAVREAVRFLEGQVGVRRGHNGIDKEQAVSGLLAVGFDHRQTRAGDPHLHTHLIIANRVQGQDGRWTAIDAERTFYPHLMAADAIYRNAYQRELTRQLGVAWTEADEAGNRELKGIPTELIRKYSKRRQEIKAGLDAWQAEGKAVTPTVADRIAHETRAAKEQHVPEATLRARWEVDEPDHTEAFLRQEVADQVRQRDHALSPAEIDQAFAELAGSGPRGLTARQATFTRSDVIRALGGQLLGVDETVLQGELVDRFLTDHAVEVVRDRLDREELVWSTRDLLDTEQRMLAATMDRQAEGCGIIDRRIIQAAMDRAQAAGRPLGEDQAAMLRGVASDGQGVSIVVGRAGSGKTTAADAIRYAYEAAGYEVLGAAPTGRAARQLNHDTGMDTATVDRLLGELDSGQLQLSSKTVLFCDEAGMVHSRNLTPLLRHAQRAGAKVIEIGDHKQLPSVQTGGGFRAQTIRLGAYELTENRRQRNPIDQQAVELLREGKAAEALEVYDTGGQLHAAETRAEADQKIVQLWWEPYQQGIDIGMFDYRRADVAALNQAARERMLAAGRLGEETMTIGEREFRTGDWVVCGRNADNPRRKRRYLGITNGTKGYVTRLNPERGEITIRTQEDERSKTVTLPAWYLTNPTERRPALDHAYATTVHKTQGATYDRGVSRASAQGNQQLAYVATTRVRERIDLVMVGQARELDPEMDLPPGPAQLGSEPEYDPAARAAAAASRDRTQVTATDQQRLGDPVRRLPTRTLRDEAAQLDEELGELRTQQHRPRTVELQRLNREVDAAGTQLDTTRQQQTALQEQLKELSGLRGLTRRAERDTLREQLAHQRTAQQLGEQQLARLEEQHREVARHERQRAEWTEAHRGQLDRHTQVQRELAWRKRAEERAAQAAPDPWLTGFLGERPDSVRGARRWRQLAGQVADYRQRYGITDPTHALGGQEPPGKTVSLEQRRAQRDLQQHAARLQAGQRRRAEQIRQQPTRTDRIRPAHERPLRTHREREEHQARGLAR